MFKGLIFIFGSNYYFIISVFTQSKKFKKKKLVSNLKENIRLLREENLRQPIDYSLTPVRQSLINKIGSSFEESTITKLARN